MKGLAIFGGILAFCAMIVFGSYNGLVNRDENVSSGWSEVQNQLKRRNDMIPQLVEVVKGYAAHESRIFEEVANARSRVGNAINVDVSKLANDPALQKQALEASQQLSGGLSRLLAVAENYPTLKADGRFADLQTAIEGTENRIGVARGRAIDFTKDYNKGIRTFPTVIIANMMGFEKKAYYKATEAEQAVPKFSFTGTEAKS